MKVIASNEIFTQDQYIDITSRLIEQTRNIDATVIPHSENELAYRYDKSLIMMSESRIIGHIALCGTEINEVQGQGVGEMGSVIIDPNYRSQGLGEELIFNGVVLLGKKYSGIIAATINPAMEKILMKHKFDNIPFPDSCYNGGKKYLAPLMNGGEKEFKERAKCLFLERIAGTKERILQCIQPELCLIDL